MSGQRYAIWGSAGHARVLASLIRAKAGFVLALFDNQPVTSVLKGVDLYIGESGFDQWAAQIQELNQVVGLVAIGGSRGKDRSHIQDFFRRKGLRSDPVVHPTASVCSTAQLGEGTQVLAQAVVAADARLGKACIVNHRASVDHECILGNGVHVAPGATLCGCVVIADHAMVGAGAVVLPRLKIGESAVIGAGAVVTRDVPAGAVLVGNPAQMIS